MRFKVGDKVIVKSFYERPKHWNIYGRMDHWMGRIVTIRDGHRNGVNPYSIEEDTKEGEDYGFGWRESDFLLIPKPGDKVRLRTWEDMEKQYGLHEIGCIETRHYVVESMRHYCGRVVTVSLVNEEAEYLRIEDDSNCWAWSFCTIEEVYPKEEDKMEKFTKDMLKSGEHVVEFRNGDRKLYRDGCFVGPKTGTFVRSYSDGLKHTWEGGDDRFDIMAVYKAISSPSFEYILKHSDELIWKRDDEPIEIPATEAFAQLREIYGKEVKIVEDKYD